MIRDATNDDDEGCGGGGWGDVFWGVCKGKGKNRLGRILMAVRQELTESESSDA